MVQILQQRVAIIEHPQLGTLRAVGSFRPDERRLFEAQFGTWSMRCIYFNGDRYLLESEYAHFSAAGSGEWDEPAIQEQYLAASGASQEQNFEEPAQDEAEAIEQFAVEQKKALKRYLQTPIINREDAGFGQVNRTYGLWQAAAVVASRVKDGGKLIAFRSAANNFEKAIVTGKDHRIEQREFHRQLLALAAPDFADEFDAIWPQVQVSLRQNADVHAVISRLCAVIEGDHGEPFGADNPVRAMGDYLSLCAV